MRSDISKTELYNSVKSLIDSPEKHLHFNQHKLYTLFSIAFQYMLFNSTKEPGAYIIRVEDARLAEKLAKKSKDPSTRKFMQSLLVPRKIKFEKSMLYLDFFNVNSWNITADIKPERIKGAVIVKDTSDSKPMDAYADGESEADQQTAALLASLPENYYLETLKDVTPNIIAIGYEQEYAGLSPFTFPFIVKEERKTISGVTINSDVSWDKLD
jgi:hypothetical protein